MEGGDERGERLKVAEADGGGAADARAEPDAELGAGAVRVALGRVLEAIAFAGDQGDHAGDRGQLVSDCHVVDRGRPGELGAEAPPEEDCVGLEVNVHALYSGADVGLAEGVHLDRPVVVAAGVPRARVDFKAGTIAHVLVAGTDDEGHPVQRHQHVGAVARVDRALAGELLVVDEVLADRALHPAAPERKPDVGPRREREGEIALRIIDVVRVEDVVVETSIGQRHGRVQPDAAEVNARRLRDEFCNGLGRSGRGERERDNNERQYTHEFSPGAEERSTCVRGKNRGTEGPVTIRARHGAGPHMPATTSTRWRSAASRPSRRPPRRRRPRWQSDRRSR